MLRVEVINQRSWCTDFETRWKELVGAAPSATMFQTFEWQNSWWKQYRGLKELYLLSVYEGELLVGLFPLARSLFPWRTLTAVGHGKSDYLHPICRSGYEEPVGRTVADHLQKSQKFDLIELQMLREQSSFVRALEEECLYPMYPCPVLDLPDSFEAYFSTLNERLRRYVLKFDRLADSDPGYKVYQADATNVEKSMLTLFELHTKSWQARGQPGGIAFSSIRRLFLDWAAQASKADFLRLYVMEVHGRPVGTLLAARVGRTTFAHMLGIDPDALELRPGWVLYAKSIENAIREGCLHYDFMLGDESYKYRLRPQNTYQNLGYRKVAPGIRGSLARYWFAHGLTVGVIAKRRLKSALDAVLRKNPMRLY